jgi:hypothetical protein
MRDITSFGIDNCIDLFFKMKNEFSELSKINTNPYVLFNYLTTGNHIIEWILNDEKIDCNLRGQIVSISKIISENSDYAVIHSLCNRSKHFKLTKTPDVNKKEERTNFDFNIIDFNDFHFGIVEFLVEQDGEFVNVYDVCERYFIYINNFFKTNRDEFIRIGYLEIEQEL